MASAAQTVRVRFGAFEFDLRTGELSKYGTRIRLQDQPAHVLRILISQRGGLVTRQELRRELWPADVFTDFEHGIHRAVNRIRVVLGDTAATPKFIATEAKRGYRFIAAVEPVTVLPADEQLSPNAEPDEAKTDAGAARDLAPRQRNWLRPLAAALVLVVLGAGFTWNRHRTKQINFRPRDFVLVSQFDNRTGDPALDTTLDFVLETELSQSEFVNVAPRQRVQDVLALMKKPANTPTDAALAREICLRDPGIRAFITGRVDKIGTAYVLTADLVDPSTGAVLLNWSEQAASETEILPALHRLSNRMRRGLGENVLQEHPSGRPLEVVTTTSLKALQEYSEAVHKIEDGVFDGNRGGFIDALERAMQYDPQFASAQIRLADQLSASGRVAEAAPHYEAAKQLADGVTDRERFYILGTYYEGYRHDDDKAIGAYEELLRRYPDDVAALRRLLFVTGRPELSYRAADLRPNNIGFNAWAWVVAVENYDPALQQKYYQRGAALLSPETLETSPGADVVAFKHALDDVDRGDLPATQADLKNLGALFETLGPRARNHLAFEVGNFYCYLGELRAADHWFSLAFPQTTARGMAELAYARRNPTMTSQLERISDPNAVALLATLGDQSPLRKALAEGDLETAYRLVFDGAKTVSEGHREQGIAELRRALAAAFYVDQKLSAANLLAQALEQSGDVAGAAQTLSPVTSSSLLPMVNLPVWALETQAHLAQLYRKLGRVDEAVKIEDRLRVTLRGADPDFVLLKQGKPRLARNWSAATVAPAR